MSDDTAWRPILTVPIGEPVELAEFPHLDHKPNVSIAMSREGVKLAFPKATHWRRVTPETAKAISTLKFDQQ